MRDIIARRVTKQSRNKSTSESAFVQIKTIVAGVSILGLLVFSFGVFPVTQPVVAAEAVPNPVTLEQWKTSSAGWITGALQSNNSSYSEGDVVPIRLDLSHNNVDENVQYTFSVCRNYENGVKRGYLFLDSYDTSVNPTISGSITSTDGAFDGINVTIDSVSEVGGQGACNAGDRETIVNFTKTDSSAFVLWGGHLASPSDSGVGDTNGASEFPGGSLHMKLLSPNKDLSIQTSAITPEEPIIGCTDPDANNYDPEATEDDGSCTYPEFAKLTLQKTVVKDDGGTAVDIDWTLSADGPTPITGVEGDASITAKTVDVGAYTLSESNGPGGYTPSDWDCGNTVVTNGNQITLADQDDVVCTITNDDQPATLIVIKTVDNGDQTKSNVAGDFTINVTATNASSDSFAGEADPGTTITLDAGSYSVDEADSLGYVKSLSTDCSGTIANGETKTCIITNNDPSREPIDPTIQVVKIIDADGDLQDDSDQSSGGAGWQFDIAGDIKITGNDGKTEVVSLTAGTVAVSETLTDGYVIVSASCSGATNNGVFANTGITGLTISSDQTIVCTFYNTPVQTQDPSADLEIEKIFNPNVVQSGDDSTITLTVTNHGPDSASDVVVTDVLPACMTFVSADPDEFSSDTWSVGTLALDESASIDIVVTVTCDTGDTPNTASVDSSTDDPISENNTDTATLTVRQDPPQQFTLNITTDGDGEGVVEDDNENIFCDSLNEDLPEEEENPNDCQETYPEGTVVNLTANAHDGSTFANSWSVTSGSPAVNSCTGPNSPCAITINGDITLNAHFSIPTPPGGGGGGGGGSGPDGTISGVKYNDLDGDGTRDIDEPTLAGWTIYIDENSNGVYDNGEEASVTDANGNYLLTGLSNGQHTLREILTSGWTQTEPGNGTNFEHVVTITNGNDISGVNFGNQQAGSVLGESTTPTPQVLGETLPRTGMPLWMLLAPLFGLLTLVTRKQTV